MENNLVLQGFNWESWKQPGGWYQFLEGRVLELAEAGITHIWLPPPSQSVAPEGIHDQFFFIRILSLFIYMVLSLLYFRTLFLKSELITNVIRKICCKQGFTKRHQRGHQRLELSPEANACCLFAGYKDFMNDHALPILFRMDLSLSITNYNFETPY